MAAQQLPEARRHGHLSFWRAYSARSPAQGGRGSRPRSHQCAGDRWLMGAAEIRPLVILAFFDNAAADRARVCEQFEQGIAIIPPDRALKRGQILAEALQHLQNRILVGEEDVPPHCWI